MIRADHPVLRFGEQAFAHEPLQIFKGLVSVYIAYPIAERRENRNIRVKLAELRQPLQATL